MKRILFYILLWQFNIAIHGQNIVWDLSDIDSTCLEHARKACNSALVSVTDKQHTISGNKHNFEALSIYYWPDPTNPKGPYIYKDGQSNPEYQKYDLPRLVVFKDNLIALSKAFHITGDETYFLKYISQLDHWFINKETRMTPHFDYNQFAPGHNEGKGSSAGIIDAYCFIDIIESIHLVNLTHHIGSRRMKKIRNWFTSFVKWMQDSPIGKKESQALNNHGTAYDVLLFYLSYFTGNKKVCQKIEDNITAKRIEPQILEDGKQPLELKRTRAMHYSLFNLSHLVDFCVMQKRIGNDFYQNKGERIKAAFNYVENYIERSSEFPYQETGDWEKCRSTFYSVKKKIESINSL